MSINKIEIQDGSGNVYYPKTSIDSVIYSDNTSIGEKIIMLERKLIELKSQLADSINNKTGSSLTSNSTVDEMTVAINSIKTLEQATADANATAGNILVDKTAYVNGAKITGTMPNKGAVTASLNCGGSYTIPAGYHNGSGKVTANSLSSQTSANATAGDIISGKTAWVNGSKITGTATIASLGGLTGKTGTIQKSRDSKAGYHYFNFSSLVSYDLTTVLIYKGNVDNGLPCYIYNYSSSKNAWKLLYLWVASNDYVGSNSYYYIGNYIDGQPSSVDAYTKITRKLVPAVGADDKLGSSSNLDTRTFSYIILK